MGFLIKFSLVFLPAFENRSGRAFAFWATLLTAFATTACTSKSVDGERQNAPVLAPVLQVQLTAEPVSLDPALAEDGVSMRVLNNVMEGLVGYDNSGKLVNRIASRIRISPNRLRYEFTLRKDARWSDGKPIRISDFIYGFRRTLDPKTGSKLAAALFPIRNARRIHEGKAPAETLGATERDGKLVIELEKPASFFLEALSLSVAMPAREDALQGPPNRKKWGIRTPVSGPYFISRHQTDQEILLEPNPHYYGYASKKLPGSVLMRIVQDESTAVSLFESGALDILTKVPAFDYTRLKKSGVLHVDPYVATYFLSFNTRKSPFDRTVWRRAVSGAIRRSEVTKILDSGETPALSWIPKGIRGFFPFTGEIPSILREAIDSVAQEVAQKSKTKPLVVSAGFDSSTRNATVLQKVQQDLKQTLGLQLELSQMDWRSYVGRLSSDPPEIWRFGWLAPFNDPIFHLRAFTSDSPNNYTGWKNAAYDQLVEEIAALPTGKIRDQKISKAQRILIEQEAIVVPLYHYVQTHAVSSRVKNFGVNPFGVIRFDEIRTP